MGTLEERRGTFDQVAELYDRYRPGYPGRLIEDVIRLSAIPGGGRILEIGAGPGQATEPFARRGYRITALEPGPSLAAIARKKLAPFAGARVVESRFEEWESDVPEFDLVIAAQSFHFIEPGEGLRKIARLLRRGGAVALFGHRFPRRRSALRRRIQDAYAAYAPDLGPRSPGPALENQIDRTGLFGTVLMARYRSTRVYTAEEYASLMETQSDHRLLPADRRAALLEAIREAIRSAGGSIAVEFVTHLHLAATL